MGTLEKADAILVDVLLVTRTKETVGIENLWKKKGITSFIKHGAYERAVQI